MLSCFPLCISQALQLSERLESAARILTAESAAAISAVVRSPALPELSHVHALLACWTARLVQALSRPAVLFAAAAAAADAPSDSWVSGGGPSPSGAASSRPKAVTTPSPSSEHLLAAAVGQLLQLLRSNVNETARLRRGRRQASNEVDDDGSAVLLEAMAEALRLAPTVQTSRLLFRPVAPVLFDMMRGMAGLSPSPSSAACSALIGLWQVRSVIFAEGMEHNSCLVARR